MVAAIEDAQLGADSVDAGLLWAAPVIPTAYVPGELLPPDAVVAPIPVVTLVSPPEGTPLQPTDAVIYDVTCAQAFRIVAFRMRLGTRLPAGQQSREAAYDRDDPAGAWDPKYAGSSIATIATGYRLTLCRSPGWPPGGGGILPRVIGISGGIAP